MKENNILEAKHIPFVFKITPRSHRSVDSIAPMLRVGQYGVWISVGETYFSPLQNNETGSGTQPTSYSMGTCVLAQGKAVGVW